MPTESITSVAAASGGSRRWTLVLGALLILQILMLAIWLTLDMRPPRWDEAHQLAISQYSFEKLRQFDILGALKVTSVTLTKPGFIPFLSSISYFILGNDEFVASFLINSVSLSILAWALWLLSRQLYNDVLVAAATFSLISCNTLIILFLHFYTVEIVLAALVTLTIAVAVEIRARAFTMTRWSWMLAVVLAVGMPAKHLYAPFVLLPLLFISGHYLLVSLEPLKQRLRNLVIQAIPTGIGALVGLSYHILNWAIIDEQFRRSSDPAFYKSLGVAPTNGVILQQIETELFLGYAPWVIILLPLGFLLVRLPFAFGVLVTWMLGVWLVLTQVAGWPMVYYFMPIFPAIWLAFVGAISSRALWPSLRTGAVTVMLGVCVAGAMLSAYRQLGTSNLFLIASEAPRILLGGRPQKNPFVDTDSTQPKPLDGNVAILPYAHDWKMDEFLKMIAGKVEGFSEERVFNVGLMSDGEYMSRDLLSFKMRQYNMNKKFKNSYVLGSSKFSDIDFLIMKTGEIYKGITPALEPHQIIAEAFLADNGAALKAQGFELLGSSPLPDGSTGSVWFNQPRLKVYDDLIATFSSRGMKSPLTARSEFTIDGDSRPVLYAVPAQAGKRPTSVMFKNITIPANARLKFGTAVNPEVWEKQLADGVKFVIDVQTSGGKERLFDTEIDPVHNAQDRRWFDYDLSLGKFAGQKVALILTVLPRSNRDYDQAGWSCLCVVIP